MQTKIIIKHTSNEALKASPLWQEIMAVAFDDGDVQVVEIAVDDQADAEAEHVE